MEPKIGYELYEQMTFGGVEPSYCFLLHGLPMDAPDSKPHESYSSKEKAEVAARELLRLVYGVHPVRL